MNLIILTRLFCLKGYCVIQIALSTSNVHVKGRLYCYRQLFQLWMEWFLESGESALMFTKHGSGQSVRLQVWHSSSSSSYWLSEHRSSYPNWRNIYIFKWANPGLFFIYFRSFQTNNTIFYNKSMWNNVMSIQYMALGFKPTTYGMWVSSHNH